MKENNYNELMSRYEAYQSACEMHRMEPDNDDYSSAVDWSFENLMDQLRFVLWDEHPSGLHHGADPLNDLPD